MLDRLFVYGTLMAAAADAPMGGPQRARLFGESRPLALASISGRLVDFGSHPGLLAPSGPGDIVHGELLELLDPAATFAWLDGYEGIEPGRKTNEYAREVRPVRLADGGGDLESWVYLYIRPITRARLVAGGRWLAR